MPNTDRIFESNTTQRGQSGSSVQKIQRKGTVTFIIAICVVAGNAVAIFFLLAPKTTKGGYLLKAWEEAAVTPVTIRNIVSSTGVIELQSKNTLLSPQTAQVSAVYVAEGDSVAKDQPLVQLNTDDLKWNLVVSEASYDEAVRDATMTDTLELARLTKEQTVAQHKITLSNRVSELAQLQKEVDDLRTNIAECTIRSGIDGRVYSLDVAVGDRISSYDTVAVVADPADIQAGIDVPENRINEVKIDEPVTITVSGTAYSGKVKTIASSATTSSDSSSATVYVVAGFDEIPSDTIVGGSISVDIQVGLIENALTLPRGPYLSSGNYSSVCVIDSDNRAVKRTATFGITDGNTIQILTGLKSGDRVITSAYQEYIHLSEVSLMK